MENCKINFCYVCGHYLSPKVSRTCSLSENIQKIYRIYFNLEVFLNKTWAPDRLCKGCYTALDDWSNHKRKKMNFGVPMIWADPGEHDNSKCYGCVNVVVVIHLFSFVKMSCTQTM